MIQGTCILKYKDKNNQITGYRLKDDSNNTVDVYPEQLKYAIKNKQVQIINLTLTSDNRLVDSVENSIKTEYKDAIADEEDSIKQELKEIASTLGDKQWLEVEVLRRKEDLKLYKYTLCMYDNKYAIDLAVRKYMIGKFNRDYIKRLTFKQYIAAASSLNGSFRYTLVFEPEPVANRNALEIIDKIFNLGAKMKLLQTTEYKELRIHIKDNNIEHDSDGYETEYSTSIVVSMGKWGVKYQMKLYSNITHYGHPSSKSDTKIIEKYINTPEELEYLLGTRFYHHYNDMEERLNRENWR